jgi:hypothetical protein
MLETSALFLNGLAALQILAIAVVCALLGRPNKAHSGAFNYRFKDELFNIDRLGKYEKNTRLF